MYQLIDKFIDSAKEMDDDIFPFMANKKERYHHPSPWQSQ